MKQRIIHFIPALLAMFFACQNPTTSTSTCPFEPGDTATILKGAVIGSGWYCTPIAPMRTDRAVGQKGKFWPTGSTIKIGFYNNQGTTTQRDAVKAAYAKWGGSANLKFEYPTSGNTNIRVSFNPGSAWSYVGTDCNFVGQQYSTLNYGSGGSAVIEHEAGHSLGFLHEQQIKDGVCWNEANVIADLSQPPNSWSLAQIRFNVLDYHNPANVITNGYDKTSIMHYAIKASWTCNGVAIPGGTTISAADKAFAALMYPGVVPPPPPPTNLTITRAQADSIKVATKNLNDLVNRILK